MPIEYFSLPPSGRSNVGLVTAQKLARHSDPKLTSNVYSKVSTEERSEAVNGIVVAPSCTTICTTKAAFSDKDRPLLTITEEREEVGGHVEKTYKTRLLAQKRPVGETTGRVDRGGLEPPTPGFSVQCSTN